MEKYYEIFGPIYHTMRLMIDKLDENDISSFVPSETMLGFCNSFVRLVMDTVDACKKSYDNDLL